MIQSSSNEDNSVVTVTLNRPEVGNALSTPMLSELLIHLEAAKNVEATRVIVLAASGTSFCAGADLRNPPDQHFPDMFERVLDSIASAPQPVVARVSGHVRAGGIGLVAACDLAVCSTSATFAFTEVRVGVVPAFVAVSATRLMPARILRELVLTGRQFTPEEALSAGLLNSVVDVEHLDGAIDTLVTELRAADPQAAGRAKRLLRELPDLTEAAGYRKVSDMAAEQFSSPAPIPGAHPHSPGCPRAARQFRCRSRPWAVDSRSRPR